MRSANGTHAHASIYFWRNGDQLIWLGYPLPLFEEAIIEPEP